MSQPGIAQLKHIVVLMMENRSFDHLLGYMMAQDSRIDGVDGTQTNPDTTGAMVPVQPSAEYQSQLQPDPGHHYPDVDLQIFGDPRAATPNMQGFIKAYYQKQNNVQHSHYIMNCFPPAKVPVITTLASNFLVFNRWFSSLPGPTIPNRAFAHFGTSFGKTDMDLFYLGEKYKTIYERMVAQGHTAKIYYYDPPSATLGMTFILKDQPALFAQFDQFQKDCASGNLPDYSFIEPNYTDHTVGDGTVPAADQHPDHNVLAGEEFIASVYMNILNNEDLWNSTVLLVVYDEHGGIYDHVQPPSCTADEFTDAQTGFKFDRLGIRVPAILISPWIPKGRVVPDPAVDGAAPMVFDHASIPATVTAFFGLDTTHRSPREAAAATFLNFLTLDQPRTDYIGFQPNTFSGGAASVDDSRDMNVVPIQKTPDDAADPDRPISVLLQAQVEEMRKVELTLPADQQTNTDISQIKTEAQSSDYKAQVMAKLLPKAAGK
jgi:phospholipase C